MNTQAILLLLTVFLISLPANARVLLVGPGRGMTLPSQASAAARDGDTVLIDAASYSDACRWTAGNLLLRGVGGRAHVRDKTYGGKAIWVIQGNNTTVENIEFSGATVPDRNGAGIRMEGTDLTIRNCYFHDNEDGILAGDNANSRILIEFCEFARNGFGDGYSHNMYINHIAEFTIRYSFIHRAKVGHNIKSRAHRTFIICNGITSGDDGTTSREIDLPNGGLAVIAGNVVVHGGSTQNSNLCGYGMEGLSNPSRTLFVTHNTFSTARGAGTFVQLPGGGIDSLEMKNNLFAGRAVALTGGASAMDTAANILVRDIADLHLQDPAAFDFRPLGSSPAVDGAVPVGDAMGVPLLPSMEYEHPAGARQRVLSGPPDIGAMEFLPPASVSRQPAAFRIDGPWPNPSCGSAQFRIASRQGITPHAELTDLSGRIFVPPLGMQGGPDGQTITLDLRDIPAGWYVCRIRSGNEAVIRSLIVR